MGWFRDMITGQQALHEQQQRLDILTADFNEVRRERQDAWNEQARLRARANELVEQKTRLEREVQKLTDLTQKYFIEKQLLVEMLGDCRERMQRDAGLVERIIAVERHNATAATANQWAVAHINMLTTERASLLAQRGLQVPVPTLAYEPGDIIQSRGAPAQPFDTVDPPPPGPIQGGPSIMGVPIPDGQTAGDVLAKLRASRDAASEAVPAAPEDLLRAASDIFSDLEFPDPSGTPQTPFTE